MPEKLANRILTTFLTLSMAVAMIPVGALAARAEGSSSDGASASSDSNVSSSSAVGASSDGDNPYAYDETDAKSVKVTLTISSDGLPIRGNDSAKTTIAGLEVEVPYFDLSLYGLEDYYRYHTNGATSDYIDDDVVERPTAMHLFIYVVERFYMGLPESQCGRGQDVSGVLSYASATAVYHMDGTKAYDSGDKMALLYSESSTAKSTYMENFFGHDENLMYYVNHVYPLMSEGIGATADYILLSDGDAIDLAMFSNPSFRSTGRFLALDEDAYECAAADPLSFRTMSASTSSAASDSLAPVSGYDVRVYDSGWNLIGTVAGTASDLSYAFESEGTYYLMCVGESPGESTCFCAPGVAKVAVSRAYETREVALSVVWDDDEDLNGRRPSTLAVTAYDGEDAIGRAAVSEADGWTATIKVRARDLDGAEISGVSYVVAGVEGYSCVASGESNGAVTITCTYTGESLLRDGMLRLWGSDRFETADAVAREGWPSGCDYAVVACAHNYPDALAAATLAGALEAPLLLTDTQSLTEQTRSTLVSLAPKQVYVVGGTSVVASAVSAQIASATGAKVARVSGAGRAETAVEIAKRAESIAEASDTCIIANGWAFADALAVAPYAYWCSTPILLAEEDGSIGNATLKQVAEGGYERVIVVGGAKRVSEASVKQLEDAAPGIEIERWSGDDRYATAVDVAKHSASEGMTSANVSFATGNDFPDALSGAMLAGKKGEVLLLADGKAGSLGNAEASYLSSLGKFRGGFVFGGGDVFGDEVVRDIESLLG